MCFSLSQTDGRRCHHKPVDRPKTSSWMENCTKFGQLILSKIIKIVGNSCQLILSKIIKIVGNSCQILSRKCTKFDFGWGSAPDPAGGAHSVPPDPLAAFRGPIREGKGRDGEGKEKGKGEGRGRPFLHCSIRPYWGLIRPWRLWYNVASVCPL